MNTRSISVRVLLVTFVAFAMLLPSMAAAQTFARVTLIIEDSEGNPIPNAKVTVTSAAITTYKKELKTKKNGKTILSVVDGTKLYDVRVEAEGYPTTEVSIKPQLRQSIEHKIVMAPDAGKAAAATGEGVNSNLLTPAQKSFNAGVEAAQADDFVTAKAKFQEAIQRDDNLAYAHLALAGLQAEDEEWAAAMASVERSVELDPNNIRAQRLAYDIYVAAGEDKKAKATLSILTKIDQSGDSAAMVFNEGVTAFKVGDNEAARTSFERALELQPDLDAAMRALALIYYKESQFTEAVGMVEKYLEINPEDNELIRMRWDLYKAIGDTEKEAEAFKALAAADPEVMVVELFNTGAKLFEGGNTKDAQGYFERVLEIDPNHARSHYQLALCLVTADPAKAKTHFEKFIEVAPDDPEVATAKEMMSYLQ